MGFHPNGDKQLTPKLIMKNVKKIASGINHLVMLSRNNVYTMGCGDEGQLGRVCQKNSNRESRVGKSKFCKKKKNVLSLVLFICFILQNYC